MRKRHVRRETRQEKRRGEGENEKRRNEKRREEEMKTPLCVRSKRLRVYGQDVSVCTGNRPECHDTIRIFCRLRGGSNNTDIPGQWQCANCDATRCWPVRRNCYRCGAPRPETPPTPAPWITGRSRGRSKGPLGRDPPSGPTNVPPRFGNRVSCPLVDRQVLGLEPHPKMLILLR